MILTSSSNVDTFSQEIYLSKNSFTITLTDTRFSGVFKTDFAVFFDILKMKTKCSRLSLTSKVFYTELSNYFGDSNNNGVRRTSTVLWHIHNETMSKK